jgi:hypothetical protein
MKKLICKCVYDTETAEIVKKITHGNFGDDDGYEITLYKTPEGNYFIYTFGGKDSDYSEEKITRLAKKNVDAWLAEH